MMMLEAHYRIHCCHRLYYCFVVAVANDADEVLDLADDVLFVPFFLESFVEHANEMKLIEIDPHQQAKTYRHKRFYVLVR